MLEFLRTLRTNGLVVRVAAIAAIGGLLFGYDTEDCGAKGMRIEDPARCGEQLKQALAMDGPVIVER